MLEVCLSFCSSYSGREWWGHDLLEVSDGGFHRKKSHLNLIIALSIQPLYSDRILAAGKEESNSHGNDLGK